MDWNGLKTNFLDASSLQYVRPLWIWVCSLKICKQFYLIWGRWFKSELNFGHSQVFEENSNFKYTKTGYGINKTN